MINNYIIYSVYSVLWIRRSFIRCQQSHSSFTSQHRVKLSDIMIQADFPGNPGIERIIYFRSHSSSLMRDHQKLMSKLKPESRCSFHFALLCLSSCGTRTLGRPASWSLQMDIQQTHAAQLENINAEHKQMQFVLWPDILSIEFF